MLIQWSYPRDINRYLSRYCHTRSKEKRCEREIHIVNEASGEVDKHVDKTIPLQRKKAGRPCGKSNKYAGLPPCSTSSRLKR